ncbi:MAG TPA: malonyl-CoA synthase [Burkholderiales bacterium]|nr:malonyl-CoA synthase [Burkholderiales bacterium]
MNENLYALIETSAAARADAIALETDAGETISYEALHEQAARYATFLIGRGLVPGERVAVHADKSAQALCLYLGCLRAGLVYLPLNTAYQRGELEYFLGDAEPRIIVCGPAAAPLFEELAGGTGAEVWTLDEHGVGSLASAAAKLPSDFATAHMRADDLAVIVYTSGTTGRSKGAMVTHRNLASNVRALIESWGFRERDVLLHALPMFHVHGLFVANHCALVAGAKLLWHRRFDARVVLQALPRATVFMGVPTYYTRLLAMDEFGRGQARGIRLFVSGSAPLLAETFREFEARTGQRILERYGMSEAGMIASNPLDGERRAGTVGMQLPGVSVRIADSEDRTLATGEIGGIQVTGDNVFAGYWRMPEKTREEFTVDGWFRTGDLGTIDSDGYLSIVGRAKDLIISGGYNVYPKEIELAIDDLPGVAESAVFGVPHADFGEAVVAVVVAQGDASLDGVAISEALKTRLANYKVPKQVYVVAELPRNAMGKVQKALLRSRYNEA